MTGTAAGAAAIVAGTGAALGAAEHPDAELLALGRQYDAIQAKIMDGHRRIELISPRRPRPIEPEAMKVRDGDAKLGISKPFDYARGGHDTYTLFGDIKELRKPQVRRYYGPITLAKGEYSNAREIMDEILAHTEARAEPWPEAQARADEIVAAYDAYSAEFDDPEGVGEAILDIEAEIDRYHEETKPVVEAMVAKHAVTIEGLMVKARAIRWLYFDDPEEILAESSATDDRLLRSITSDLWAMQEGQA